VPVYFATQEFWFRVAPGVLQPGPGHKVLLIATSLPLIGALAELNFRFVEDPLRRRGARIAERIRRRDVGDLANLTGAVQTPA
jgi:peptidoglycan/LPS O-acetylase OafA/YrhL